MKRFSRFSIGATMACVVSTGAVISVASALVMSAHRVAVNAVTPVNLPYASATASSPPEPPHRIRKDDVLVALPTGRPREDWAMRESEPLIEPDAEARPVTVAFHSLCGEPQWTCDWFQYSDLAPQWQLCPRAPVSCGGNAWQWSGSIADTRRLLSLALAKVKERHGDRVRVDGLVLVGYSQGAYTVASLVHGLAEDGVRVKGLVLHGAQVHLAVADLKKLGARVGLVAGDLDGAAPSMRAEAESLRRQGIDARFVSLGKVGHFIPTSTAPTVAEVVDWARGIDDATSGAPQPIGQRVK